jgi:ATP-binding cassette subfamily F protein 3
MIFDEPTNHLDIEARDALVTAIGRYEGAVILITHDFYTLSKTCDQCFVIDGGKCTRFNGTLEEYREFLLSRNAFQPPQRKNFRAKAAKKDTVSLEKAIKEAEAVKKDLEGKLSQAVDGDFYDSYVKCCEKLRKLEDEWLSLN